MKLSAELRLEVVRAVGRAETTKKLTTVSLDTAEWTGDGLSGAAGLTATWETDQIVAKVYFLATATQLKDFTLTPRLILEELEELENLFFMSG